jgi:hypothetical protein
MTQETEVKEALRAIMHAAIYGGQGASDWLQGKCTIGISQFGYFLDYTLGRGRASYEAIQWRTAVYERDGYTCRDCGAMDRLHAHHIELWSEAPDKRFEVDNGVTLCLDCHAARHPKHANLIRSAPNHA